jgi:hypothetical protein
MFVAWIPPTGLCTTLWTCYGLVTSRVPACQLGRPQPGDNSVDVCSALLCTGLCTQRDNMCVTPRILWVTTPSPGPLCGWRLLIHSKAELSTSRIHGSSTDLSPRHLQRRGLSTLSTGPMTMTRPKRYGSRPAYLGITASGMNGFWKEPEALNPGSTAGSTATCWRRVKVALGSIRTSETYVT